MKRGIAGSLESNDALITVKESDKLTVTAKSIVCDFFGAQIEQVIRNTLKEAGVGKIEVVCEDKGAYDYTIRERLLTALARMEAEK